MTSLEQNFQGRRVVVTGGAGFIGSNLVRRLVGLGANVRVLDSLIVDSGANLFNLRGVESRIERCVADLGDVKKVGPLVAGCDLVFNLAGHINHLASISDPVRDLALNCESQLRFLEVCRAQGGGMKIVFTSTRQVYGAQDVLPVDENVPPRPCDVNGIHKLAAEAYHLMYSRVHGIRTTVLRLSNVYGPRMLVRPGAGTPLMGRLICKALDGETLEVFGDGKQLRDVVDVEDAVDGLLAAACAPGVDGEIINLGGTEVATVGELARAVLEAAGGGTLENVPFPVNRKTIDIGSIYLDCAKAARLLGWRPRVSLGEGLARAVAYHREHRREYWSPRAHALTSVANTSV